ncbi:hypothetical protein Ciccas_000478 [Cichlidogyrus casuarinus]|uniref:Taste receptor type 2 n=1 Tax=Cichlidogyrus casuarinus TaxID=1844966 RepID=A0ABD2QMT9_9PLAT
MATQDFLLSNIITFLRSAAVRSLVMTQEGSVKWLYSASCWIIWKALMAEFEEEINSQIYVLSRVCFTLSFVSCICHLAVVVSFRRVQILYGINLIGTLVLSTAGYALQLSSCLLSQESRSYLVIRHLSNFSILAANGLNFSTILWVLVHLLAVQSPDPKRRITSFFIKLLRWLQNIGSIHNSWQAVILISSCILLNVGLPLFLTGISAYREHFDVIPMPPDSSLKSNFSKISCNLPPTAETTGFFFAPLLGLLFCQASASICCTRLIANEKQDIESRLVTTMSEKTVSSRYIIASKICFTNSLTWLVGFIAVQYKIISVWHIYVLISSLQSIFITINCIFSRPVLDHIHQWKDEKHDFDLKLFHHRQTAKRPAANYQLNNPTVFSCKKDPPQLDVSEEDTYSKPKKEFVYQIGLV